MKLRGADVRVGRRVATQNRYRPCDRCIGFGGGLLVGRLGRKRRPSGLLWPPEWEPLSTKTSSYSLHLPLLGKAPFQFDRRHTQSGDKPFPLLR